MNKQETWLKEQIEDTFERIEKGEVRYYSEEEAETMMDAFILSVEKREKYPHKKGLRNAALLYLK